MSEAHKRKCWNCGNIAVHMKSIVPEVLCTKCGSQDTRRIKGDKPKPFIKVTTQFLEIPRIEVSDGVNSIKLGLTRNGIESLIGELQTILDMTAQERNNDGNEAGI